MSTPYDGKILLVNYLGRTTPGDSVGDLVTLLRAKVPNVAGVMLKTSNGVSWQGHLGDDGPQAVTGVRRIEEWVEAFTAQGLEVHAWGVPQAKRAEGEASSPNIEKEAEKFIGAAMVPGVKSVLLDVELGAFFWQGSPDEVRQLMTLIRRNVPDSTHIGMILDGRRNRPFSFWVDPWIPFVDSLHPMVYPILFGSSKTIAQHLDDAFQNLGAYNKPIVPMLQAFGEFQRRPTPEEIIQQGEAAWAKGAAGISFFRLGSDVWAQDGFPHMGEPEYGAIAAIAAPAVPGVPGVPGAPTYSWQDVINASLTVALRIDGSWDEWWTTAGVWAVFDNSLRLRPYAGPPIAHWSIPAGPRGQIIELLKLDSVELAQVTAATQAEKEREEKEKAAAERQQRGSIVGVHGAPGIAAPRPDTWDTWINFLKEMGIRWYKQCDSGDPGDVDPNSTFAWAKRLKAEGIEPIIRYLQSEQFPDPLPDVFFQKMALYAAAGIVWAEIGNEPNLDIEWKSAWHNQPPNTPMRHTDPEVIRLIAETWVRDAQRALDAGVRPAFYAFAPTDWRGGSHPLYSSVFFQQKVIAHLAQNRRAETIDLFERGAWIAVHAATYEQPLAFEIHRPDGTIWDMTLRSYEVALDAFREQFGADIDLESIPVMSTEGGVFTPESTSMTGHERLQTNAEHAQRTVEMFRWLERHSPLQAMCPWCLSVGGAIGHFDARFQFDGWIEEINGTLRPRAVLDTMTQLRFDLEREAEQEDEAHELIKLDLPYISQFDETARTHNADCGPACVAMILNAQPAAEQLTVDELYVRHLQHKAVGDFTTLDEMGTLAAAEGVPLQRFTFPDGETGLAALKTRIQENTPVIALVNYAKWDDIAKNNFTSGHFVVVSGWDEEHVFVHDPLFRGSRRSLGEFFVWRNQRFLDGWGSGNEIGNPNFVALVPNKQVPRLG
jgi:predicted double-glycine peptidase